MPMDVRVPLLLALLLVALVVLWRQHRPQQPEVSHQAAHARIRIPLRERLNIFAEVLDARRQNREDNRRTQNFASELRRLKRGRPIVEHEPDDTDHRTGPLLKTAEALDTARMAALRDVCEYCGEDHEGECQQMIDARGSRDFVATDSEPLEPLPPQEPSPYIEADVVDAVIVDDEDDEGPGDEEPPQEPHYTENSAPEVWQPELQPWTFDTNPVVARIREAYDRAENAHNAALSLAFEHHKPFELARMLVSA